MNRFPCACPRAKQIVGAKNWLGYAGCFAFPGFKANWLYTQYTGYGAYVPASGQWTYSVSSPQPDGSTFNYACTGTSPDFAAGDLVLREFPAAGPLTDYLTGLTWSYPKYYQVYICTAAITGSAADPSLDSVHFELWDYGNQGAGTYAAGPSGWPSGAIGGRAVFPQTTDTAQLELTVTTALANFPLFPATISGLTAALGYDNDTAAAWNEPTAQEASGAGTFVYDWTWPTVTAAGMTFPADGSAPVYTAPGTAPTANQAPLIFPNAPARRQAAYNPEGHYPAGGGAYVIDSVFGIGASNPPALTAWSFSARSISLTFAAWSWNSDVEYSIELGHSGALATAPGTITQTVALGGASYSLAEVAAEAAALMGAAMFDSIGWGTSWTYTWDTTGAVVSSQNFGASAATAITASGAAGTPVPWAVAVNGCPFIAGGNGYFMTRALVDVCGNYCTRTYAEGSSGPISCANGNVDGYAPVELDPPGAPGQSAAIYAGVQCG